MLGFPPVTKKRHDCDQRLHLHPRHNILAASHGGVIQLCKRYTLQSGVALFVLFVKVGTYEVGFRRSPAPKLAAHRACRFDCLLAKPNPIQLNSHQVNSTKPKSTPNNFARTIFFSSLACAIKYVYICENIGRLSKKKTGGMPMVFFFSQETKKNQPPNATYSGIT